MRLHRFYVNKPLGEELVVESADCGELIHQWLHVFRYQNGDEVILFSHHTSGFDFLYRITSISKQALHLVFVSKKENIIPRPLTLVMALVKKDTFETIVRQAAELGVTHIIPLPAGRSEKKNLNFERLRAIATEASEQSGRGSIPHISEITPFEQVLEATTSKENIVGSLNGSSNLPSYPNTSELCVWVGPEGGWTEDEEHLFKERGFYLLTSAKTVLRADTAATHLLTLASFPFSQP